MTKIHKRKLSPRQKMINLMYVVLMAMLALNVSSDGLNGFTLVDEGLNRSTSSSTSQNNAIYSELEKSMKQNPEKVKVWYAKAQNVRSISDSLYKFVDELKYDIVRKADGEEADVNNIRGKEDLEAASFIMLSIGRGQGGELKSRIDDYRENILKMITDPVQRKIIGENLSTEVPFKGRIMGKNWQEYMFENTPAAAAVTLLSKLQSDIRYAEGEVLHNLIANIDVKDVRVNEIQAYVIPRSQTVIRGGRFSAQIVMAAVDTTQRPDIYIGNTLLKSQNGTYETVCRSTGDFTLKGYIEMKNGNGERIRREFVQPYTVVEPSATVSATMMNMLYAGYQNPISVSVPGIPISKVSVSASGASLTQKSAGNYIAVPSKVGQDVTITVNADMEGGKQEMGKFVFHVRKLPDPTAFIAYKDNDGNDSKYRGGTPISKSLLLSSKGLGAAIDDGLLNIPFRVIGFETVFFDNMGNAVPEVSNSSDFTDSQRDKFRRLTRGRRFNISRVKAVGPDGIERTLPYSMEVIVN